MTRMIHWLGKRERQLFFWINHKLHHRFVSIVLYTLTHLGGATFTITFSLALALLLPAPWDTIGWQCLVALAISHIPVAIIKKVYPRIRPHLAIPNTRTYRKPLVDHSFPSGHTTAIFSLVVPIIMHFSMLAWILLPIAGIVALSRMYLGLHYPSDCLVGAVIGTSAAVGTVMFWHY